VTCNGVPGKKALHFNYIELYIFDYPRVLQLKFSIKSLFIVICYIVVAVLH